jgi:hypothetical protein
MPTPGRKATGTVKSPRQPDLILHRASPQIHATQMLQPRSNGAVCRADLNRLSELKEFKTFKLQPFGSFRRSDESNRDFLGRCPRSFPGPREKLCVKYPVGDPNE